MSINVGNGYVSMLANDKSYVYLKQGRTFGLKVPYKPFFTARLHSQNKSLWFFPNLDLFYIENKITSIRIIHNGKLMS